MTKRNFLTIVSGIILVLCGAILITQHGNETGSLIVFNAGMVMIIGALVRHYRYGTSIERDELSNKLAYTSLAASFQLSFFVILILWWLDYLKLIQLTTAQLLAIIAVGMGILPIITKIYYARKIEKL